MTSAEKGLTATESHAASSVGRNIPSLDGLRAISIALVVLSHSIWFMPPGAEHNFILRSLVGQGIGVGVFFVISGYLITTLILREFDKTGTVSLRHFYFRRSMRIFPPFYFYLAVIGALWTIHFIPEHWPSFLAAATYTWCYLPWAQGVFIQHSWSLSIEEQFYLLWPLLILLLYKKQKLFSAGIAIIAILPVVRLAFYFLFPSIRAQEYYMIYGWIDTMMVGCILAIARNRGHWVAWERRWINGYTAAAMTLVGFCNQTAFAAVAPRKLAGFFSLAFSPTITAFCIGGVLLYVTAHADSLAGRFLNNRVIRHFGVISYSLYLWQQLFTSSHLALLPYGYLYTLAAAEFSFWVVERPSLMLRGWWEKRIWPKP